MRDYRRRSTQKPSHRLIRAHLRCLSPFVLTALQDRLTFPIAQMHTNYHKYMSQSLREQGLYEARLQA